MKMVFNSIDYESEIHGKLICICKGWEGKWCNLTFSKNKVAGYMHNMDQNLFYESSCSLSPSANSTLLPLNSLPFGIGP